MDVLLRDPALHVSTAISRSRSGEVSPFPSSWDVPARIAQERVPTAATPERAGARPISAHLSDSEVAKVSKCRRTVSVCEVQSGDALLTPVFWLR